ncbi:MAG TPA: O-antigen ligase family protein, partial [Opitutaceae bacterium]|nr:O-antigen ligase family protein [Opitutaceae bacterium]
LQATVLAANLVWTTLCLGGYRPETMVITSALTCVLLGLHLVARTIFTGERQLHPAGWFFVPFLAYAAANVVWVTPVRWLGWHDWLWWAQLVAVFWVVLNDLRRPSVRQLLMVTLAALGFVAVVLAAYQAYVRPDWLMLGKQQAEQFIGRSSGPFGIPNSLAGLLLLLLPPAVMLAVRPGTLVRRLLAGYLAAAFLLGLVLTVSRGAWLGLAVAALLWPLLAPDRSWRRRLGLALGAGLLIVTAGWGLYTAVPPMRERFDALVAESGERTRPIMWRGAWQLFRENPVWGSGAGSYNIAFEKHRPEHYQLNSQWAHNDYLNTLSDYGAVGFGLFFGAVLAVLFGCRWHAGKAAGASPPPRGWLDDPWVRQGAVFGLLAFGLQLFVDFHLKIPALAMALAVVAGLLVPHVWPANAKREETPLAARVGQFGLAAALVAVGAVFVTNHYRAEALRYPARLAIDRLVDVDTVDYREVLAPALASLERATKIDARNAQAWSDLAYATGLWAHVEPENTRQLGMEAEAYARWSLSLSRAGAEPWIRLGIALNMQGRWPEAGEAFSEALGQAPASARVWFHQAYHLSLNPITRAVARSAVALSLRLDPDYRPAQVLRQQLASAP